MLWMRAQVPIGGCAGQSDCEPGPVSVGTRNCILRHMYPQKKKFSNSGAR